MDAVFARDSGSLFRSDPLPKSFYCPTTPRRLNRKEQRTTLTPTQSHTTHSPPHTLHWDVVCTATASAVGASDTVLSTSGSSKFNESWPSNSELEGASIRESSQSSNTVVGVGSGNKEKRKNEAKAGGQGTLAKYIERFRKAPPTSRNIREVPSRPFWWKHSHVTAPGDHVTPPREPQSHSTPESHKTTSYTDPSPRVSTDPSQSPNLNGSLEARSQELIDKSSSLLSDGSSTSSIPAQKYFNTHFSPTQRPGLSNGATAVKLKGIPCCSEAVLDPKDDILYQWRLKRRLELARREAARTNSECNQFQSGPRLNIPPHSHKLCDILPCVKQCQLGNNSGPTSGQCLCANEPRATSCCKHQAPLQKPVCDCLRTEVKIQTQDKVTVASNLVNPCHGDSSPVNVAASSHIKDDDTLNPSSTEQDIIDNHIGSEQTPPNIHSTQQAPKVTPPVSINPPCQQEIGEEEDNDVSLSNFSLNFTTEIDQTPSTNKEGPGTNTEEGVEPVVSQVVKDRLFRDPLPSPGTSTPTHAVTSTLSHNVTPTPPHSFTSTHSHMATSTPPCPIVPGSVGETTSKTEVATSDDQASESCELPWDCHMNDDLLKMLITKAKLFEEQIKNIDSLLSAMTGH